MNDNPKGDPMVSQAKYVNFDINQLKKQWAEAQAKQPPSMFPGAGQLGQQLTQQVLEAKQQAASISDTPLMSQSEMLSVLLAAHQMLADSMKQLTETMNRVLELQQEDGK